jgi:hypothetical protein
VDSAESLAITISEASQWMDTHCFHRNDGSFAATITNEQMWVKVKPNQSAVLICNFKPIIEVVGLAVGPAPGQLQTISQNQANLLVIGNNTITIPGVFVSGTTTVGNSVLFNGYPAYNGGMLAVYTYVAGYPHTTLAATAQAGATTITVNPPNPGGTVLYGAYAGTALTIKDGAQTETVTLSEAPSGLTLNLASPLVNTHTVPNSPDAITVTALPNDLERACIHLTNVLLKAQGMRAQMPPSIGSATPATRQGLGRAGVLADFDVACKLLAPYKTSFLHA